MSHGKRSGKSRCIPCCVFYALLPKKQPTKHNTQSRVGPLFTGIQIQENRRILMLDDCLHFHAQKKNVHQEKMNRLFDLRFIDGFYVFFRLFFCKEKCDWTASGLRMSSLLWPNNCSMPEATSNSPMYGDAQQQPMAASKNWTTDLKSNSASNRNSMRWREALFDHVWGWFYLFSAMKNPCCHPRKT